MKILYVVITVLISFAFGPLFNFNMASANVPTVITTTELSEDSHKFLGYYWEGFTFESSARDDSIIAIRSFDFDAYLIIINPDGEILINDDHSLEIEKFGNDAGRAISPSGSGTWLLIVTTYSKDSKGTFEIFAKDLPRIQPVNHVEPEKLSAAFKARGIIDPKIARQESISVIAERLSESNFRNELNNKLRDEVLKAKQDQDQARQNLNAAEILESQHVDALEVADYLSSSQYLVRSLAEEELTSIRIDIEHWAKVTFDSLGRINGFEAVLEELTRLDLLASGIEEVKKRPLQSLRPKSDERHSEFIGLANEIAERLYAMNILESLNLYEDEFPPSSNDLSGNSNTFSDAAANGFRIDWITGTTVQSPDGEIIGSISDVIMDGDTGEMKAAIVGMGGFLGIGEKQIALPWNDLEINYEAREITSDLTSEEADAAPEYVFRDSEDAPATVEEHVAELERGPIITPIDTPGTADNGDTVDNTVPASDAEEVPQEIDPTAFMPELFPWPPPEASARANISRGLFGSETPQNLGSVADTLQEALADAGYAGLGYLGVPGGFAIITRIEQLNDSGRPLAGSSRWATRIVVVKSFSISGIIRALMTAEPGFFRVLVLVITDRPFNDSGHRDRLEVLERWSRQGLNALVPVVRDMPFSENYKVTALIYEFEKSSEGEDPLVRIPGRNRVSDHLAQTDFYQFLR